MISLTNVIKKLNHFPTMNAKVISLSPMIVPQDEDDREFDDIDVSAQAKVEAEMLVKQATEKAEAILKKTEETVKQRKLELQKEEEQLDEKINAALEDARLKGYKEGYEQGCLEGKEEIRKHVEEAQRTVDAAKADYLERIQEAESTIVKLAVKMAEKIVGTTLDEKPDYWFSLIKSVLKEVKEHDYVKIYVHPIKYDLTVQKKKEFQAVLNDTMEVYIYPDQDLSENGCLVETSFGTIDASVDRQLSEIKAQLLELVEESENES